MPDYTGKVAVAWLTDPEYDRLRWAIADAQKHEQGPTEEDEQLADHIAKLLTEYADRAASEPDPEEAQDHS